MSLAKDREVIILNGDTFFDVDLNVLATAHSAQTKAILTVALKPMKGFDRYGNVVIGANGQVLRFNEKQFCKEGLVNGGVYVLTKNDAIFEEQPRTFSFETAVMQEKCGETGCLYGVVQDGYFIDIGIPEDYRKANIELSEICR